MAKDYTKDFNIINIRFLAERAGIPYSKVRNCIVGRYESWTEQEQAKLFNVLEQEVNRAKSVLGYSSEGRRIKPKD
jgi:hypothetical protein